MNSYPWLNDAAWLGGYGALTVKARRTSVPFTFAEAERDQCRSQADWIFGFSRSYNMRDGLYCTYRAWAVVFVSTKLLALRPSQRAFLAPPRKRPLAESRTS